MYVSRRTALEASTLFRGSRKGVVRRPSVRARAKEERSLKSKTNRVSQRLLNVEIRSLLLLSLSLSLSAAAGRSFVFNQMNAFSIELARADSKSDLSPLYDSLQVGIKHN